MLLQKFGFTTLSCYWNCTILQKLLNQGNEFLLLVHLFDLTEQLSNCLFARLNWGLLTGMNTQDTFVTIRLQKLARQHPHI